LPNGKIDRQALPVVDLTQRKQNERQVTAYTPLQEILVLIWKAALGVRTPGGIHENFFALGGHSLLVTQVVARIRQMLGVEVPLRSLFEAPTIARLAQHIEGLVSKAPTMLIPPAGQAH